MATLQELKTKIENANALGKMNLAAKGIEVSEDATTYEIMQTIADIVSEIATTKLTVAPIFKGVADITPSGSVATPLKGNVSIVGEGKIGEILELSSEEVDLNQCDFQWYGSRITKHSHSGNFENGVQNGYYQNSFTQTEVVTIEGAPRLMITVKYGTEPNYDYVSIYEGNHPDYVASTTGYLKKLSGVGEETFVIEGESATFAFKSDSSGVGSGYGYYATIIGEPPVEGATQKSYTIQDNDSYIYCEITGKNDFFGTITTETITVEE